ncbi:MAG: DUF1416 domain-containing protein, partial [Firmicutes bacterium]|nr:DUF1416 domain-containing protein [Bacillota bacterium]
MRISKSLIVVLAIIFLLAASYFTAFTQDQSAPVFQRAYITGTITADGKPCGGARVRASFQTGEAECISASNGHYALGVGQGTWKVDVSKEGYKSPPTKTASVEALRSKDQVDFNLAKSAAWIKGKTLTTDGKVLSRVMVTAGGAFAISDNKGNFTLSVDAGKYEVTAMKVNYTLQNTVTVQ